MQHAELNLSKMLGCKSQRLQLCKHCVYLFPARSSELYVLQDISNMFHGQAFFANLFEYVEPLYIEQRRHGETCLAKMLEFFEQKYMRDMIYGSTERAKLSVFAVRRQSQQKPFWRACIAR
jgi:hypothetical protein